MSQCRGNTRRTPPVYVNLGASNTFVLVQREGNGLESFVVVRSRAAAAAAVAAGWGGMGVGNGCRVQCAEITTNLRPRLVGSVVSVTYIA